MNMRKQPMYIKQIKADMIYSGGAVSLTHNSGKLPILWLTTGRSCVIINQRLVIAELSEIGYYEKRLLR